MAEAVLDDIWAEEAGVSIRLVALEDGKLRIEFTEGVNRPVTVAATLTNWRARRASTVLAKTFLEVEA